MSKILKINQGDYVVQVEPGKNIILDAGESGGVKGTITLKGNLIQQGTSSIIEAVNTVINDNIFVINRGELGPGINVPINNGLSGFKIDRGTTDGSTVTTVNGVTVTTPIGDALSAQVVFSETDTAYVPSTGLRADGSFVLQTSTGATDVLSNLKLTAIELRSISSNGTNDIVVDLRNSASVVKLVNSTDALDNKYHERVVDDDCLVTKKFVSTYIASGTVTPGMADVDKIYKLNSDNTVASKVLATLTSLDMIIGTPIGSTTIIANVTASGLNVNTINSYAGLVVTVGPILGLPDQSSTPTAISGKSQLYSKATVGSGNSGLFFKNSTTEDELVATNRALLFSMLF
jgi:hypothetical protein